MVQLVLADFLGPTLLPLSNPPIQGWQGGGYQALICSCWCNPGFWLVDRSFTVFWLVYLTVLESDISGEVCIGTVRWILVAGVDCFLILLAAIGGYWFWLAVPGGSLFWLMKTIGHEVGVTADGNESNCGRRGWEVWCNSYVYLWRHP